MSLFKSREWWSTQCGIDEEFENTSLLISRLNSVDDYVIVGSQSGYLRVFLPSGERLDDGQLTGYKPTDLIIETQLSYPVLQICTGRLVSGSQIIQLAILHPRSVGVYSLVTKTGVAEQGLQSNILLVYEHLLKRATSNLIVGPFGGSQKRDFMCIQSLDGMLTFFEQEIFSFCCFLPEFLLPSPVVFVRYTDSFVTCSSNWQIVSFGYKRLSENSQRNQSETEGIKFDADWSYNIGENVLDIAVAESAMNDSYLVILGERNMFCLSDSGKLKFMKRFDFSPQCFYSYFISTSTKLMILVVTETSTLLLYENATLRWSAQLSFLPIAVGRGSFSCLSGSLVLLSDIGSLQFCYLGTDPQLFTAPPLQNQELDFEKAEEELTMLNKMIRMNRNNDMSLTNAAAERELIITVSINPHLEPCTFETHMPNDLEDTVPMCLITVELLPNAPFEEVQISIIVDNPLVAQPNIYFLENLEDRVKMDSYIYLKESYDILSFELKIVVSHITNVGVPRILIKTAQLPMKLAIISAQVDKEATQKVTLNINESAPALSSLFPGETMYLTLKKTKLEYMGENSLSLSSNSVAFKNVTGAGSVVTILLAKSSQRYRLQSNSIASLNLIVDQLTQRLKKHFENNTDFNITHNSTLPMVPFMVIVERHFIKRNNVLKLQNDLSELSAQYRLIQKRLIIKFKDKNPTSLKGLDTLMVQTYTEIMTCSDELQLEKEELKKTQSELSCVIRLILLLLQITDVTQDLVKKIMSIFVTPVCDIEGQGWEDVIDLSASYLLRTVLAKSEKDKLKNTSNGLETIKDINKLKKRILHVFDRVSKGGPHLHLDEDDEKDLVESEEVSEELETFAGSKIAASSVRAQSAKIAARSKLLPTPEETEDEQL